MKKKIILIWVILIVIAVSIFFINKKENPLSTEGNQNVCTMDAKICPDGTAVGRSGPKCEFVECPTAITNQIKEKGVLNGKVTVGPVCPADFAVKYPTFSCEPTPDMYAAAKVFVYSSDKKTLITTIIPDKDGKFSISLAEGKYFVDMTKQTMGGTYGVPVNIEIAGGKTVTLYPRVDTGLR